MRAILAGAFVLVVVDGLLQSTGRRGGAVLSTAGSCRCHDSYSLSSRFNWIKPYQRVPLERRLADLKCNPASCINDPACKIPACKVLSFETSTCGTSRKLDGWSQLVNLKQRLAHGGCSHFPKSLLESKLHRTEHSRGGDDHRSLGESAGFKRLPQVGQCRTSTEEYGMVLYRSRNMAVSLATCSATCKRFPRECVAITYGAAASECKLTVASRAAGSEMYRSLRQAGWKFWGEGCVSKCAFTKTDGDAKYRCYSKITAAPGAEREHWPSCVKKHVHGKSLCPKGRGFRMIFPALRIGICESQKYSAGLVWRNPVIQFRKFTERDSTYEHFADDEICNPLGLSVTVKSAVGPVLDVGLRTELYHRKGSLANLKGRLSFVMTKNTFCMRIVSSAQTSKKLSPEHRSRGVPVKTAPGAGCADILPAKNCAELKLLCGEDAWIGSQCKATCGICPQVTKKQKKKRDALTQADETENANLDASLAQQLDASEVNQLEADDHDHPIGESGGMGRGGTTTGGTPDQICFVHKTGTCVKLNKVVWPRYISQVAPVHLKRAHYLYSSGSSTVCDEEESALAATQIAGN